MIYKQVSAIQDHTFKDMDSFVTDLEDTFQTLIQTDREEEYRTMYVVAPKYFIEDLIYYLIISPHLSKNMITRFSLFDDYSIKELNEIFNDERNDVLMLSIAQDRVCFVNEVHYLKYGIMQDDIEDYRFVYLHSEVNYKYLAELKKKNVPTLIADFVCR